MADDFTKVGSNLGALTRTVEARDGARLAAILRRTETLRDAFLRASRPNLMCSTPGCLRHAHLDGEHVYEQLEPGEPDPRD